VSANQPVQVTSDESKLLTVLDGMWPSWHSCSRLAAELGFRSARLWPSLTRLRKVGLVESREQVWDAESVVYEQMAHRRHHSRRSARARADRGAQALHPALLRQVAEDFPLSREIGASYLGMYEAKGYAKEASNRHALTHAVDTATRVSEAMIATTMSFFNESSLVAPRTSRQRHLLRGHLSLCCSGPLSLRAHDPDSSA
jgi:biotin operon repressor